MNVSAPPLVCGQKAMVNFRVMPSSRHASPNSVDLDDVLLSVGTHWRAHAGWRSKLKPARTNASALVFVSAV